MSLQDLSLDIRTFILTATLIAVLLGIVSGIRGLKLVQTSGDSPFFRQRQKLLLQGWRLLFVGFLLLVLAIWLGVAGEESAYRIFPVTNTASPTASITIAPSSTLSPTLSLTPSITATLEFTYTPSPSAVPKLPRSIINLFESEVTPNPGSVFSPLVFSRALDFSTYSTIGAGEIFLNPVNEIFASFSYDQMLNGVQWTALWYRQGELVNFETQPWDGGTGGLGFTEWSPESEDWFAGVYQVQIFVGFEPIMVGEFIVEGDAVTSTPSETPTATATPSFTPSFTPSITATHTRFPTDTAIP